jgi:hypothetical protein
MGCNQFCDSLHVILCALLCMLLAGAALNCGSFAAIVVRRPGSGLLSGLRERGMVV